MAPISVIPPIGDPGIDILPIKSHPFYNVFLSLIRQGELVTLNRLLGIVATQETRFISKMSKVDYRNVGREYLDIYSTQFLFLLNPGYAPAASNVGLSVLYCQLFNLLYKRMSVTRRSEDCHKLKSYMLGLFEEMCVRFLDDRILEFSYEPCTMESGSTCYHLVGSCVTRLLFQLLYIPLSVPDAKETSIGKELLQCIKRYNKLLCDDSVSNAELSSHDTPTKTPTLHSVPKRNIIADLLTPYDASTASFPSPLSSDLSNHGAQLTNSGSLLRFVVHAVLQLIYMAKTGLQNGKSEVLLVGFINSVKGLNLPGTAGDSMWETVYDVCFFNVPDASITNSIRSIEQYVKQRLNR
ncbi:hypothetical protein BBOV_I000665 [Babesia bovis T2Bo]|uniref:hypothetical protein n=1 Tax=Babesia bovis T2Bo TaxID=484906 RepID=UPI001C344C46|nr:hypothetical protein BBOV_I000665 [Babesia bovis T2Bo]KAG6440210.1 hypothetical protein BBOV_I000665 [Babesia bovis T2Bo]